MECKVVTLLTFCLIGFCLGGPECNSNQCSDLWTAKKCDKIKYCIAEDWSRLKPTGYRDNVCDICLRMVKEARDTLQNNETREQLLEVFEGSCRLLVLQPAVEVCDKIVDRFVPELVEILSSEMDPEIVCSVAKLCNNEAFRVAQKNSKECVECEKFSEAAAHEMKLVSSESFKNSILSLCRNAGGFSDACSHLGSRHSGLLYNNSKIILSGKPCEAISVCPSGLLNSKIVRETKKPSCPLCMRVMKSLREQLLRVKSFEEFGKNILSVCGKMGFPDSSCSGISSPSLYEKLKSSDTLPEIFCQITYCGQKSTEEVFPIWLMVPAHNESFSSSEELNVLELLENLEKFFPLVKQEKTELYKPAISFGDPLENPVFFAPSLYVTESGDCETCTDLLETLSKSAKTGQEYSGGMLKSICKKAQDVAKCERFINNFSPVLTKAYAEKVVSSKMCEDLVPSCKIIRNDSPYDANSYGRTCNFCLNTIGMFKRGDIVSWGQKKCDSLPKSSQSMCSSVFANIHSVFENSTENELCQYLQLCGPSAMILPNISDAHAVVILDKSVCEICIDSIKSLVDLVKNPNSELVIRAVLNSLCAMLPYEEGKICHYFIENLSVNDLKKFIENLNPSKACSEIYMCKKREEFDKTVTSDLSEEVTDVVTKIPCKFCLLAIRTLLDQLQDDKTEESIREALNGLCKYLPEETRETCRNLIDEYTDDIIDMIVADFNANEICTYLKICPARYLLKDTNKTDFSVFSIQTNEVRDWDQNSWRLMLESVSKKTAAATAKKPIEEDFKNFHKVVQECALCEALVGVISTHKNMLDKNFDFSAHANMICSIVPENKKKMCTEMVISYGPSIVNLLIVDKVDKDEVCVRVDLCDPKMQAKVSQPVSVVEEKFVSDKNNSCLQGPSFWCANAENAEKCGTFLHCQEMVWKNWKNPPKRPNKD